MTLVTRFHVLRLKKPVFPNIFFRSQWFTSSHLIPTPKNIPSSDIEMSWNRVLLFLKQNWPYNPSIPKVIYWNAEVGNQHVTTEHWASEAFQCRRGGEGWGQEAAKEVLMMWRFIDVSWQTGTYILYVRLLLLRKKLTGLGCLRKVWQKTVAHRIRQFHCFTFHRFLSTVQHASAGFSFRGGYLQNPWGIFSTQHMTKSVLKSLLGWHSFGLKTASWSHAVSTLLAAKLHIWQGHCCNGLPTVTMPVRFKSHPKIETFAVTSWLMMPLTRNTFFNEANNVDDLALQASCPYKAGRFPRSRFRRKWLCGWKILAFYSTIVA